ncbi:uncharacterized protein LOC115227582 [Octopus sinensis]|uniref:Mediator of RNA polymerase II transcription subunit 26 n=1 Tax=Octopus sinensis TaxID=2607531 RepID=A0A7E6EG73_9MOLL|nr:uncharacterized protein LOC115227582 [Octopus sinensis]
MKLNSLLLCSWLVCSRSIKREIMKPRAYKDKLLSLVDANYNVLQTDEVQKILVKLKTLEMTKADLEETRLGKIVNSIRRNSNDSEIASISKSLIKYWQVKFLANGTKSTVAEKKIDNCHTSDRMGDIKKIMSKEATPCKRKRIQTTAELISSIDHGTEKLITSADLNYIDHISSETYREDIHEHVVPHSLLPKSRKSRNCSPNLKDNSERSKGSLISKGNVNNEPILLKIKLSDVQTEMIKNSFNVTPDKNNKRPRMEKRKKSDPGVSPRTEFRNSIRSKLPTYDRDNLPQLKWMNPSMPRNKDGSYDSDGKLRGWTECYRLPSLDNDVCVIFPYCDLPPAHKIVFADG